MKLHLNPKQAARLSFDHFQSIYMDSLVPRNDWAIYHSKKMTAGRIMEYLIAKSSPGSFQIKEFEIVGVPERQFRVCGLFRNGLTDKLEWMQGEGNNLVDASWELAVDVHKFTNQVAS